MRLYIYGGNEDITLPSNSFYILLSSGGVQSESSKRLKISRRLNDVALKYRDKYCEFIYGLNKFFLAEGLVYKGYSLFFITDLSGKRTEKFSTYNAFCFTKVIDDLVREKSITSIIMDRCDFRQSRLIDNYFSRQGDVDVKILNPVGSTRSDGMAWLRHISFCLKAFFFTYVSKILVRHKKRIHNHVYLASYPQHFVSGRKHRIYGTSLGQKKHAFLLSVLTDGFHQKKGILKHLRLLLELRKFSENVYLLDRYLRASDIFLNFFRYFYWQKKKKNIAKKIPKFERSDLTDYLKEELNFSFLRLPRLIMYDGAVKKFCTDIPFKKFNYYLHEYSYGRFFNYSIYTVNSQIVRQGIQHGPASSRKLLYFLARGEGCERIDVSHLLLPNVVLAEDEYSKNIYLEAGYKKVEVLGEVYRLNKIWNLRPQGLGEQNNLIVLGLHDGSEVLQFLQDRIRETPCEKYIIRLHPRSRRNIIEKQVREWKLQNVFISSGELMDDLRQAKEIICTYSSVGEEALSQGLKVSLLLTPCRVSESPLLDKLEHGNKQLSLIEA